MGDMLYASYWNVQPQPVTGWEDGEEVSNLCSTLKGAILGQGRQRISGRAPEVSWPVPGARKMEPYLAMPIIEVTSLFWNSKFQIEGLSGIQFVPAVFPMLLAVVNHYLSFHHIELIAMHNDCCFLVNAYADK